MNTADLRQYYKAVIGTCYSLSVADGSASELSQALPPGRYMLQVVGATGGDVWVRQGAFGSVTATAAVPSHIFPDGGLSVMEFNVPRLRSGTDESKSLNSISAIGDGTTATIYITQIARVERY